MKKTSFSFLFLFIFLILNYAQSNSLHLDYSFEVIADSEAEKEQLTALIKDMSKSYDVNDSGEVHNFTIANDVTARFYSAKTSEKIWLFIDIHGTGDKFKCQLPTSYYENLKAQSDKRNPGSWDIVKSSSELLGKSGHKAIYSSGQRKLEYFLADGIKTSVPVATLLAIEDIYELPLRMETVLPQREGSTSKAKIQITAKNIVNEVESSIFDFTSNDYQEKSITEVQKEMGMGFMLLLLF
jgi:hypothetical protein